MKGLRVIFLGPPGVGKGTQAVRLAKEFGVPHISTGDMFRRAIKQKTPMGIKALPYVEAGQYVPDDIVNGLVQERLAEADCAGGFILDGYPRTLGQAQAFDRYLQDTGQRLDGVIYLTVPDEVILLRLTGRRVCSGCGATYHVQFQPPRTPGICAVCGQPLVQRDDDREETVKERLTVYRAETMPLLAYYRDRSLLLEIDGEGDIDEITGRITSALQQARG